MKIAVLSDVHGNTPALQAVLADIQAWGADSVIVNGDLVNRGPCSLAAWGLLQALRENVYLLRGNHENWVLHAAAHDPNPHSPTHEIDRLVHWTVAQLGNALPSLHAWADHLDLDELDGASLHITHGSRLGDRKGIQPECEGEELRQKLGDPRALFVVSHTHRAFRRELDGNILINTGSVGQPFDGDVRASYARLQFWRGRWQGEIRRVAYDREQAIRDFEQSGFLDQAGALAPLIFREFVEAQMRVGPWRRQWLARVQAGEISVAEAVQAYLKGLD
ncbi:MAG: metallophosphatase family protein [Chromatiales bacterium]|nr:metallophosphoesterase family protein [Gammaproteobacteria bacterium]MBW6477544.1 metallophosphatase family protein [Chromatiales bacterium]